jgi:hypothetical protein
MKAEIKENLEKVALKYPKLMISDLGKLVFFTQKECGFRIDSDYHYSDNWSMAMFKDFKGTITITQ